MDLYIRFLFDFMSQLFGGIGKIFTGAGDGIGQIFDIQGYYEIIEQYSNEFGAAQWVLVVIAILLVAILLGSIIFLVVLLFKKYIRVRKSLVEQEALLEEVGNLNKQVVKLNQEKDKLFAMKVSQLGLKPDETNFIEETEDGEEQEKEEVDLENIDPSQSRFYRLTQLDQEYKDFVAPETDNTLNLEQICERFRLFAASRLKLYYKIDIVRLFLASFASTRLIILQGISGTGKTSLPYAWGKFLENDAVIASVQPSWRDRTELFGFFNEFTRKFNETEVLKKMYEASFIDQVYLTILDEMNIARVEYYFAEMLSILEMPSRDEWLIELVPNVWPTDPKRLQEGKLKIPDNMWYIGTINNDDSTFMVTDKVYDRALPIDINDKGQPFDAPDTEPLHLSSKYLESLFDEAKKKYPVSKESLEKLAELDDYVIAHFRIAFGNRILKQLKDFVPAFVACGGKEEDGVDYVIAHKILRKFEQLNLSFIRDEIDGFIEFINKLYGKENMNECKDYLLRLKKMM